LLDDLHQRGLLSRTLVVVMGEFGRTPRINAYGGRDHWPQCGPALLAGCAAYRAHEIFIFISASRHLRRLDRGVRISLMLTRHRLRTQTGLDLSRRLDRRDLPCPSVSIARIASLLAW